MNLSELPPDPAALLTDEQKKDLQANLSRLARLRQDAEAASGGLVIG